MKQIITILTTCLILSSCLDLVGYAKKHVTKDFYFVDGENYTLLSTNVEDGYDIYLKANEIWNNEDYIVVKQHPLDDAHDEIKDSTVYYIVDTNVPDSIEGEHAGIMGPYNEHTLKVEAQKLGLPDSIDFKNYLRY